jgi:hypothetical protein
MDVYYKLHLKAYIRLVYGSFFLLESGTKFIPAEVSLLTDELMNSKIGGGGL